MARTNIKINYVDFWNSFDKTNIFISRSIEKNFSIEISENPDFLLCSCFGTEHKKYNCVKIFYTGECQTPDFNLFDYAVGFDHMSFGDRYFRYPFYLLKERESRLLEHKQNKASFDNRKFCSFVYSNHKAAGERDRFFRLLSEYKKVDSGGRHLNNSGGPVKDKTVFLREHKFDISFENARYPGYTTEKIVDAFTAGAIPIYWGDPDISKTFNPEAFINCADYSSFEDVVSEVIRIDNDDVLYKKMTEASPLLECAPSFDTMSAGLDDFLAGILSQKPEDAYRRNRGFWGANYQRKVCGPANPINSIYKRTLWQWKKNNELFRKIDLLFRR